MVPWLISDPHFWHYNIIKYCSRPQDCFAKIEANWQKLVPSTDAVVCLGDFAFTSRKRSVGRATKEDVKDLLGDLPGTKYLIKGNHDKGTQWMLEAGFDQVWEPGTVHELGGFTFGVLGLHSKVPELPEDGIYLSHRPVAGIRMPYFHGHIHNNPVPFDDQFNYYDMPKILGRNICVEVTNYQPMPVPALLGDIEWMEASMPIEKRRSGDGKD